MLFRSMCGIVGYQGYRDASPILIKGLKRLEYRGYDSAGVALVNSNGDINIYKEKGKVADLENTMEGKDISGMTGIAHTRWATHGEPNRVNAHPHFSESENIALVHNGIIENYATVKEYLKENGVTFRSCTDTEVLVQLIEFLKLKNNVDLVTAVQMALNKVVGAYAIVIVERNNPDLMIAARKSSPLVVGINDNEFFVASDASPIIEYTNKVIYLEDGEIAVMKRGEDLKMLNLENSEDFHDITEVDLSLEEIEKGGYPFFMIKEIFEQPKTIKNCLSGRILPEEGDILLSGIKENLDKFLMARRIIIVACGTSWHAGLMHRTIRIPVR